MKGTPAGLPGLEVAGLSRRPFAAGESRSALAIDSRFGSDELEEHDEAFGFEEATTESGS